MFADTPSNNVMAPHGVVGTCALGAVTCRQTRYSQLTRP
jgi:hypothetical protein